MVWSGRFTQLTDDERAAVDDEQTALNALLERLTDVATPSGPTPAPTRHPTKRNTATDHRSTPPQTRMNTDI